VADEVIETTDLSIGSQAIDAYSRLSYSMWNALAEFIDNSTQSRLNYDSIIDGVLAQEGKPLTVEIVHNRTEKTITIKDNSIGMTKAKLIAALQIAQPTVDSKGRSRYGMGMKTAACWIGKRWKIVTCEWGSGEEWTADVDVKGVAYGKQKIPLTMRAVSTDEHYTQVIISSLNRTIQKRTEETIRGFLGSIYRFDLFENSMKLLYNGEEIGPPDDYEYDRDPQGLIMRRNLPEGFKIGGKSVTGWVAVLLKGGRKFGGFSLFQNKRQIQGFPNAWKPRNIFGGVDEEGANNLVSQRLTGIIELDEKFAVSHTKDAILFDDDEEEQLEKYLEDLTKDYKDYAQRRRGSRGNPLTRDNVRDLVNSLKREFASSDMKDAVANSMLPPMETIIANNNNLVSSLKPEDEIGVIPVTNELTVIVSMKEVSEFEPYVTLAAAAEVGKIHVIVNGLHPYYLDIDSADAIDECVKQYIYDAIAEYRVSKLLSQLNPASVRRLKDALLRVQVVQAAKLSTAQPVEIKVDAQAKA
jgi:hypothetical protein